MVFIKAPISPRIVLVPIVPDSFLVDRPNFCENSREPASTILYLRGRSGAITFKSSEGQVEKSDRLWFLTCWKTLADKNVVVLVVRGSPCYAALWSFITSAALYRGSCGVLTECKHPTSQDPRTTTGRRFLIGYCFSTLFRAIQGDNRANQINWFIGVNLVQIGPIGKNNPWWNARSTLTGKSLKLVEKIYFHCLHLYKTTPCTISIKAVQHRWISQKH